VGVPDGVRRLPGPGAEEPRVGGKAPLCAGVPRELLEEALSRVLSHSLRQTAVAEHLRKALSELGDVPRLNEEAGDAMLDHLRQPAEPARDDGGSAGHRLDCCEAKKLRDPDLTPKARSVDGRQSEDLRAAVERGEIGVGDDAEERHLALRSKPSNEFRILALGRIRVVSARSDHAQRGILREGFDQSVDALVRRQPANEEDASARRLRIWREASGIGPSVDHPRSRRRRTELARRIRRYREKAVEEPREQTSPVPSAEPVVGNGGANAADAGVHGREAARGALQMVRMDDVRCREGMTEPTRNGMGGVPPEESDRAKDPDPEAAGIAPNARRPAERDELAIDVARKRTPELDRISLTAPVDAGRAEERRSDVNHPHFVLPLITLGDPCRLSGGYLYHLRMAEAAPSHAARIVFLSLPEWPFPLAALHGAGVLRRSEKLGAGALLLDSIAIAFAGPALALRRLGIPVIAVLHQPPGGIDHGAVRERVQAQLDRLALQRADLLIAASGHLAEQLVEAGFPSSRIQVVPPGRDVAPPPRGPRPDLRRGRRVAFLTVANWLPRKGILELLEAYARLPADAGTLHLAGDESADTRYAARVWARLAKTDLTGRVVVHGSLALEDVAALYRAADAFVLPASREPYGTVWGEAMAFGLPVVGWRAGNLPYLAEDRREGLLVEPGDTDALSRALMRLALDGDLRARLGAAARRRALSRPTWEASAALFFAAIREVIQRGAAT
jgi:glycosyltransferase involved in cell wall biosynthesis